jgi:predicted nucleic acid-binding protein
MKKVIFDASPLIFIAKGDMLGLIKKMYKKVFLSSYIMSEIERPIKLGYSAPEVDEIKKSDVVNIIDMRKGSYASQEGGYREQYWYGRGASDSFVQSRRI